MRYKLKVDHFKDVDRFMRRYDRSGRGDGEISVISVKPIEGNHEDSTEREFVFVTKTNRSEMLIMLSQMKGGKTMFDTLAKEIDYTGQTDKTIKPW